MYHKTLVSMSGGADSTTLLYRLCTELPKAYITPVYFKYGQRHYSGEIEAVKAICKKLEISFETIELNIHTFGRSALTDMAIPVPKQSDNRQKSTVVPFRNSMFLINLAALAVTKGHTVIAMGPTIEDLAEYPDCRPVFFQAMENVLRLGDFAHNISITTPFINWKKKDVIRSGMVMNVPYELTHTCYNGVYQKPCRECDACKEREASFKEGNYTDPLTLDA